jgi:glycerol-3-phosphate dehydrogenase
MPREIDRLIARTHDLLVVGGGVHGLTIACDAAARGLTVALVERHDFGSGASFNHLRTIHGGLRYLQTLDLARARESIRERRTLARIAPWALRPVPFVLPLPATLTRGPWAMRAAFVLDGLLASARNDGLPPSHHLPGGIVVSRADAVARWPELAGTRMAAAAVWYDYVAEEADRLTFGWALAAARHGAVLVNYADATALLLEAGRCAGARVVDRQANRAFAVRATITVNATGGALDQLLAPRQLSTKQPMLKAMNLVTRRPAPRAAIGGRTASGKTLFMVPWQDRALIGTWESPRPCLPGNPHISAAEIHAFINEANHAYPDLALAADDVTLVHRGVVPARVDSGGNAVLAGHERIVDHAPAGARGLFSIAGTKYTTARAVAERVVDRVVAAIGRPVEPCRTATAPLPPPPGEGDQRLEHAARDEMVVTLEDAVVRRTTLGAVGYPGDAAAAHAAAVVGKALGWSPEHRATELAALEGFYGTSKA